MASMRKMRRRLARWDRYARRYGHHTRPHNRHGMDPFTYGHARAIDAVLIEQEARARRYWLSLMAADGHSCGGWIGSGPCDCNLGLLPVETITPVGGIL